jgi:hypothetical protein
MFKSSTTPVVVKTSTSPIQLKTNISLPVTLKTIMTSPSATAMKQSSETNTSMSSSTTTNGLSADPLYCCTGITTGCSTYSPQSSSCTAFKSSLNPSTSDGAVSLRLFDDQILRCCSGLDTNTSLCKDYSPSSKKCSMYVQSQSSQMQEGIKNILTLTSKGTTKLVEGFQDDVDTDNSSRFNNYTVSLIFIVVLCGLFYGMRK